MDLMRGLTQADGCAVDGTTAGNQNPIAQMVNQMMNTAPGTGAMKGAQQQPGVMMGHPIQGIAGPSLPGQFAQHQQHLSAIDQGIAHGMGLSAAAGPMGAASASFAPLHHQQQQMNAGDAFMQEFEAERQRQHFGIHGGASGLLGPRGAPMGAASMGDEWINQFEKLKFGAGPYRPGHSMHDAFNQQFLPRSQAWANEFARPPPMAPAQHWQAQQMHTGNAWAEEAAAMKPSITITEINDNEEVTATAENAPPAVLTSDEVEKAIEESDASGSAIPESMEEMMQKAWQDSMAGKEVDFEALMQKIMGAEQNGDASWANGMGDYDDMWKQGDATDTEEEVTLPYTFLDENKYLKNESAFEEGMKLFNDGRLLEAVMAFEAVVTEDPSNSEAWRMLGLAHQERDEDIPAIACLQRAIEQDAFNLDALFAMGVSLVNEGKGTGALRMLKSWITNNPNFHGLTFEADEFSDGSLLDEVMQLMIKASKHAPNDPGVQEVLGVLYNVSEDYDSAAAAFKKAIEAKPNDYSLWNKLGATLANGKKSEEALPAYHKALELKPRYARAWLNLGIAHNNLSNFFESARCYLKTLDLNPNADHVWENLRWCFIYMKRHDLVAFVEAKNLDAFRDEFQF